MAKSRGQDFEDEFRVSIPEGVFVKKLHTPAPPPAQIEAVVAHLRRTRAPEWMVGAVSRSTHTPRQGFDMIVAPPSGYFSCWGEKPYDLYEVAPGAELRDIHGAPLFLEAKPFLLFCLEFKSTTGKSFAFSRLKDHQEEALRKEARAGRIAGVVIEFADLPAFFPEGDAAPGEFANGDGRGGEGLEVPRELQPEVSARAQALGNHRREPLIGAEHGDVLFIPIQSYLAYKRDAGRASLPYDVAERIGMRIEIDADRGRSRRYYKIGEFLRAFGGDIPEPEKREVGRARGTLPRIGETA